MNYLDIAVIIIILIFAAMAYLKGFIKACFSFLPTLISLVCVYTLQPVLSKFLRTTPVYMKLKDIILNSLELDKIIAESLANTQSELINSLSLPEFLKNSLLENNNSVVYGILDATGIKDYISGFIANTFINIISLVIIFLVSFIIAKILLSALDLISKLPGLNAVNRISGLLVGIVQGVIIVWIIGVVVTLFSSNPNFSSFFDTLDSSLIAKILYENNLLLSFVLKIFT